MDESAEEVSKGIYYVVGATVLLAEREPAVAALAAIIKTPRRQRVFHWLEEGPEARGRMVECLTELGAVAHVCVHFPTARGKQDEARALAVARVIPGLVTDGVTELLIEGRSERLDSQDKRVILGTLQDLGRPNAFSYDWFPKDEPLLWTADAVSGAVREWLTGKDRTYYERLRACGVLAADPIYINSDGA
jgi:hypothetical protein